MKSSEIRKSFLDFFESKKHKIVESAPMVIKDDPTLMFTNAGMNQFKDIFLGNAPVEFARIADSQKCLRVSGKHNDLEEVGHDTYHHTMFEMLGNWSFGDYFKEEAISWAWEYLTGVLKINKDRLYATVFVGDKADSLEPDDEAKKIWSRYLPESRILYGSKKDNFWEMGDTGPCGPCSELHVDIRDQSEIDKISGKDLVNRDHPHVIEIWNLVFIQFNRKKSGELEQLPNKHVDTGMGFERLCMVVQGKKSNYDTDVFTPILDKISEISGVKLNADKKSDIAMRVIADHLRTISFSVADGQLPSNTGAGYVIRRILRRAVRYAYTFLNMKEAFMYKLTDTLIQVMGQAYPELVKQKQIIEKAIKQEEDAFLKTLETGIKLLDKITAKTLSQNSKIVSGQEVFTLYDTYGFPYDLTELILRENQLTIEKESYDKAMELQKDNSRTAAAEDIDDWVILNEEDKVEFVGYDTSEIEIKILKYRKVSEKKKDLYQLVFNFTPFYAESGGQAGDSGYIETQGEKIEIFDTIKEHNLIIHKASKLPQNPSANFKACINKDKRNETKRNHSATHLMHKALRDILGNHVEQKGSLVDDKKLRFDFSHFNKLSAEEILAVETQVNKKIRENICLDENRNMPIKQAKELGAMALFGEKYGDSVRVIRFADSVELCGGTHVAATGEIGFFKIVSESAIAAGIRRIEALTGIEAENYIQAKLNELHSSIALFKTNKSLDVNIQTLFDENSQLKKQIESFENEKIISLCNSLKDKISRVSGINVICTKVEVSNAAALKDLAFKLKADTENLFVCLAAEFSGKANICIIISDDLLKSKNLNAGNIIREISKEINGGGGGQPNFASAGGDNTKGIQNALNKAISFIESIK